MTYFISTPSSQNNSVTNHVQAPEPQLTPCRSLQVIKCKRGKKRTQRYSEAQRIIDEMFGEARIIRPCQPIKVNGPQPVQKKLTVKQWVVTIIGRHLKKFRKETAAEQKAKRLQEKLNELLTLEAVTMREYVPESLYDELARLDRIIAQEKKQRWFNCEPSS